MKKWTKKIMFGLGIAGLVAGLSACGHQSPEERQAKFVKKMVHKLDLTEAQTPYAENLVSELAALRQDMKKVRQEQMPELEKLITSDNFSAAELQAVFDAPKQVFENHRDAIIEDIVALHLVLNAEQKKELAEKMQKIQSRFGDD
jgi:Spy/CpxP family protein refolding chaperone